MIQQSERAVELLKLIKEGEVKKIRVLAEERIQFNADIKIKDDDGTTPLHYACKQGLLSVVRILLGFENVRQTINDQEKEKGYTALMFAIYSQDDGGPEIVGLLNTFCGKNFIDTLLERGADPNVKDFDSNTALHHAAGYGSGDSIDVLFKHKSSDLNSKNKNGETPLHLAIQESQMWAFETLRKNGADLTAVNNDGDSLVHYAVRGIGNAPQFIRTLHSSGAPVDLKNNMGDTPYQLAQRKQIERIIKLFKELGISGGDGEEKKINEPKSQSQEVKKETPPQESDIDQRLKNRYTAKQPSKSDNFAQIVGSLIFIIILLAGYKLYSKLK